MFRRFIDLSLSDAVPDHSTLWRFRNVLHTENLLESLWEQINHHLTQNGIMVAKGSVNIIDATVIEAKQCRPKKNKQGNNTQDPEAAWNVKTAADGRRKTPYGFKWHANTDEDGFIKKTTYTAGNVHDSKAFDKPLTAQQKAQNKSYSSVRYVVERTFGLLKLHHGLGKASYLWG